MAKMTIEQRVTSAVTDLIDNLALQTVLSMVTKIKSKDIMLSVKLNKCNICDKQRVFIEDMDGEEIEEDTEQCFFCEKPVDADLVVCKFIADGIENHIICLQTEAESLLENQ